MMIEIMMPSVLTVSTLILLTGGGVRERAGKQPERKLMEERKKQEKERERAGVSGETAEKEAEGGEK